jgi:anti-anti-sigma regulatory factor
MSLAVIPTEREVQRVRSAPATTVFDAQVSPAALVIHGDVEVSSALLLADSLSTLLASSTGDVVVDLTDVEFVDLASLRLLDLGRQLFLRQGRDVTFRSPSRLSVVMLGLFGLTGLIEAR